MRAYGLTKDNRLTGKGAFREILSNQSKAFRTRWGKIILSKSQAPLPRLGISVAKRALAKAVYRNLAKRIVREAFRSRKAELSGQDYVVIVENKLSKDVLADELSKDFDAVQSYVKTNRA